MPVLKPKDPLAPCDRQNLRESGLTDATIAEHGFHSTPNGLMVIPYFGLNGERLPDYVRYRPQKPKRGPDGKVAKYVSKKGAPSRAYFPKPSSRLMREGFDTVFIVEGEKKSLALSQDGTLAVIGLAGVWNGCKPKSTELIDDLLQIKWHGVRVYIVYDYEPNPETQGKVNAAKQRLVRALKTAGANEVLSVDLPAAGDGGKQGIDDYLIAKGMSAFLRLVDEATVVDPEPNARSKSGRATNDFVKTLVSGPIYELWLSDRGDPCASVRQNGVMEHLAIDSRNPLFRDWLSALYYHTYGEILTGGQLADLCSLLGGIARQQRRVFHAALRTANHDGRVYIDIGNSERDVIAIDAEGWEVVRDCPPKFRRPKSQLPIAMPVRTQRTLRELLKPLVPVAKDVWPLIAAWLTAALLPWGPYLLLVLIAGQGRGKSTLAKLFKTLLDNSAALTRGLPDSIRGLNVAAFNSHLLAFDNISSIKSEMSDGLCVLATGGGTPQRANYTDHEEIVFSAMRPTILTAVTEVVTRPDLLDRCLIVELEEGTRRTEQDYWAEVDRVRGEVLGALLDLIVDGLRRLPEVRQRPDRDLSRMADFCDWGAALEPALGLEPGKFAAAYQANRELATQSVLEDNPVVAVLKDVLKNNRQEKGFKGTATELLDSLNNRAGAARGTPGWPKGPNFLSQVLNRLAPNLKQIGIVAKHCSDGSGNSKRKVWQIVQNEA